MAHTKEAIDTLIKSIENDIYYGDKDHHHKFRMRGFLSKLGIKSARNDSLGTLISGMALQVESLEAVLKNVTFDDKKLKLLSPKKQDDK